MKATELSTVTEHGTRNTEYWQLYFPPILAYLPQMFDTITAELTTAVDKLTHLRRFL